MTDPRAIFYPIEFIGGERGTRTLDLGIMSQGPASRLIFSTTYRVAPVAIGTVEHSRAHKRYANLTHGLTRRMRRCTRNDLSEDEVLSYLQNFEDVIFEVVDRLGGSLSVEHGIGICKRSAFLKRLAPLHLDMIRDNKLEFDPSNLMSPGRILS